MARVFVTGGSGFVGGRLIERLCADGHTVRALARSDRAARRVEALGAAAVRGDLSDPASLEAGAAGCELAYHAAAAVTEAGSWADFVRDNVDGTRNVVDACAKAGVRRLVHVSTEAVLMAGQPLVEVDESTPRRPDSTAPYPATKAQAEEVVLASNRDGLETVIVRPRFIWGRGDTTLLPRMVHLAETGRLAWIGGGNNLTDVTHVDNVVEGLVLAAAHGKRGNVYFVTDGEAATFRGFLSELLRTQGVEPPTRSVPRPVAGALTWIGETAWSILPLRGVPPLPRMAYWVSSQECTIDISKARRELGYRPIVSRAQGMADLEAARVADPAPTPGDYQVELSPQGVVLASSRVRLMTRRVAQPFCEDIQHRAAAAGAQGLVMDLDSLSRATPRAALYAMRSMKSMRVRRIAFTGGNAFMRPLARAILTLGGFGEFRFFPDPDSAVDWAQEKPPRP